MKEHILNLDRDRKLRFGFRAMRLIRQKFGNRTLESLMNMQADEIPVIAWAGLKWDDSKLTVEQLEVLLDESIPEKHTLTEIVKIVANAMADQIGYEKEEDKKKDKADEQKTPEPKRTIPSKKSGKKPSA